MRKRRLLLLALACAVLFTGCKKKTSADLSSLHTTAAVEKETMPTTTEAASAEVPETTAAAQDSKYSVKTEVKTYTSKNVSIEYPELSNMQNTEKQKQVNDLLKHNAESMAGVYQTDKDGQALTVKAQVVSSNLRRITVVYKGEYVSDKKTAKVFFSNTIDLETAENLQLSDYTDAYTVAGYIASGDYKLEELNSSDENAVRAYLNAADRNTDYYYKLLGASDFSGGYTDMANRTYTVDTWPKAFSYEKQGIIYISLPVSESLGSYAIVRYSPDNK